MTGNTRNNQIEYRAEAEFESAPLPHNDAPQRRNILQAIWMRRWWVIIAIILALIGGAIKVHQTQTMYEASASLVVEQSRPNVIANDPTGVMTGTSNYLFTQIELIRSRRILDKVAAMPEIRDLESLKGVSDPVGYVQGHMIVEPARRADAIYVRVRAPHNDMEHPDAAVLANKVVEAYEEFHKSSHKTTATEMIAQLQSALDQREIELKQWYEKRLDFQKRNPTLSLGSDRSSPVLDRYNQLSGALTNTQIARLELEAQYKATAAMMNDPVKIAQLMNAPSFRGGENSQLRHELREVQAQFQSLSSNYGAAYSGLQSLQASIKRLSDDLAAEDKRAASAYLAEMEAKLKSAEQQEATIKNYLNEQQSQVLALNSTAAEFGLIEAEIHRLERASDSLDQRLKELKVTEDVNRAYNITELEQARPGGAPKEPDRATIMFVSLAIGAVVGVLLAAARELTDQRLRSADDIKIVMNLPILGVVPHIADTRSAAQRGLYLHTEPMSDVAEAYRTVRTAIYFGVPAGTAKTLLITSPAPGDGKTTLASNLAVAMAQAGNRILLLDADFRKPMQHKIFDIKTKAGLSTVLAGEATLEEAIHHSPIPGLDVLPCGPIPANPSEILNSQTFADLLDELSHRYDHVILDSPPVMPVTDARILAASCDATVLALRAEKTTRRGGIYARDVLRAVGSRILGVVVNDVPRRKGIYGYYYSDSDVYQYGYGSPRSSQGNGAVKALPKPAAIEEHAEKEAV